MKEKIASLILKYNEQWEQTDKSVIADNVEEYICKKYPSCVDMFDYRWKKLVEISGAKEQTVYAWLNRSRKDVKIPFLKLCQIAVALDSDIAELLKAHE